jgi:hypothetical protein
LAACVLFPFPTSSVLLWILGQCHLVSRESGPCQYVLDSGLNHLCDFVSPKFWIYQIDVRC